MQAEGDAEHVELWDERCFERSRDERDGPESVTAVDPDRGPRHAPYPSRSSRWSPTRSAFAIAVKAGFTAPMLGKQLVSTTYRFSSS